MWWGARWHGSYSRDVPSLISFYIVLYYTQSPLTCVTVGRRASGTRRGTRTRAIASGFVHGQKNENDFRLGDLAAGVGREQIGQSALVRNHVREQQGKTIERNNNSYIFCVLVKLFFFFTLKDVRVVGGCVYSKNIRFHSNSTTFSTFNNLF